MCKWILDFPLNWTQVVRFNSQSQLSEPLTLSTWCTSRVCAFSPTVHTLYQWLQVQQQLNPDIQVLWWYHHWRTDNQRWRVSLQRRSWAGGWLVHQQWPRLELNVAKMKEMIIDFRKIKTATISYWRTTSRTCGLIQIPRQPSPTL